MKRILLGLAVAALTAGAAAAAEVDTALLSDSLPPAAFTDPGFSEYLRVAEE